jgi:outer membrane protein OmpA-like peptidoglycan-associated protein
MKISLSAALLIASSFALAQEKYSIYFDLDKDKPNHTTEAAFIQWLDENRDADIVRIYAHTDSIAGNNYNQELSKRRLHYAVSNITKNITDHKYEVKALGETQALQGSEASNRRVDIWYNPAEQPVVEEMIVEEVIVQDKFEESIPTEEESLVENVGRAKVGDKLKLPGLNFYNDSDVPLPESQPILEKLLSIMRENPNLKIDIQGHICCLFKEEENLSSRRAKTVYKYLIANNINKKRLSYQGFASSRPIYALPEKTEEEKTANRRVEIEILAN